MKVDSSGVLVINGEMIYTVRCERREIEYATTKSRALRWYAFRLTEDREGVAMREWLAGPSRSFVGIERELGVAK